MPRLPKAPKLGFPHGAKQKTITRLVKPDSLKAPGAWPREMKLLNQLIAGCPEEAFWLTFQPGHTVFSLAWYKTPGGAIQLRDAYTCFKIDRSPMVLDTPPKPAMMDTPEVPRKRMTVEEWADTLVADQTEINFTHGQTQDR